MVAILDLFDNLIEDLNYTFDGLVTALILHDRGNYGLENMDNKTISFKVDADLKMEPIPLSSIIKFKNYYPNFLFETYHGKIVQIWNNFLEDLFGVFCDLHFEGKRNFIELRKQQIKLDFNSETALKTQLQEGIISNFSFLSYDKRIKIINNIFISPPDYHIPFDRSKELLNIKKNIIIRNSYQHNNGLLDKFAIKKLGGNEIQVLNNQGDIILIKENGKIPLSLPEIYSFRTSVLRMSQIWRVIYGQL